MKTTPSSHSHSLSHTLSNLLHIALGTFLVAIAIEIFFRPNALIDGGILGLAMIVDSLVQGNILPGVFIAFNAPFLYLAYKHLGKGFVINMVFALLFFAGFSKFLNERFPFYGEMLEVVVGGGIVMGIGIGLIIRTGACLDGTEILAIIVSKKKGFTVGQVILFINIFIFALFGYVSNNWHVALNSFMTYIVAMKMIDMIIVGFDETKSVMIISLLPNKIAQAIMKELGIGLTVMYGRGGFSGEAREILYVIIQRLQLADLKEIIHREDPNAFIAIENLNEVVNGQKTNPVTTYTPNTKS
ncbi:MAG: yqfU [Chlamydiales bacterium]|jgi:uncharacterized membrane-anchored protein YitT (DUF2179 family)|nr:yqfU [Chlamydiales bacterium]